MKFVLIFVLALVAFTTANEQLQKLLERVRKDYAKEIAACIKESKVERQIILNMFEKGEFPDHQPLKCYSKCIMGHFTLVNDDGTFNVDNLESTFKLGNKALLETIAEKCKRDPKETDDCSKYFDMGKCAYHTLSDIFKKQ